MKVLILSFFLLQFACGPSSTPETSTAPDKVATVQKPVINNVDVATAKKMIADDPELIVIDVRTPKEFAAGTLPEALNIDVKSSSFKDEIAGLDKEANYLLHCRSGKRSMKAAQIMIDSGFLKITNMDGGYLQWQKEAEK